MAILKNNPWGELSGSIGGNTFQKSKSGKAIVRRRVVPVNPKTGAQVAARLDMQIASQAYVALTSEQKQAWEAYAVSKGSKSGRWSYIQFACGILAMNRVGFNAQLTGSPNNAQGLTPNISLNEIALPLYNSPNYTLVNSNDDPVSVVVDTVSLIINPNSFALGIHFENPSPTGGITRFNNGTSDLVVFVELTLPKGNSKYKISFASTVITEDCSVSQSPILDFATLTFPPDYYKYLPIVGQTCSIDIYFADPMANYKRGLAFTKSFTVQ